MELENKKAKNVLFAIPSSIDSGTSGDGELLGPILQLLKGEKFDKIILCGLQFWKLNAYLTQQSIKNTWPNIDVEMSVVAIKDINSYKDVFYNLKIFLSEYTHILNDSNVVVSFLLPPTSCDKLFDSWLLLATSLNLKAKIFQEEQHYSLEGVCSENIWNKDLDWLEESSSEFNDNAVCVFHETEFVLSDNQIRTLRENSMSKVPLLLENSTWELAMQAAKFINKSRIAEQKNCLMINCDSLPGEIADSILLGYGKKLANNKQINRKGLVNLITNGTMLLFNFDKLNDELQTNLLNHINKTNDICHLIAVENSDTLINQNIKSVSQRISL